MFRSGEVRVITSEAREDGKSIKLKDLIADPVWGEAVEASPLVEHFLSAMPYDEFIAAEGARVLSYRCGKVINVDCVVADPAGALEQTTGAVPLSLLNTPAAAAEEEGEAGGWTHLWIDVLNHLNDPAAVAETVKSSGDLYLSVPILPQSWANGDYEAAVAAMQRGWIHQELAYGRLDRGALEKFVRMCCARYAEQTNGKEWKGNPADLEGPKLLTRLIGKRVKAAASHAASAQAACEWYGRVNKIANVPAMAATDVGTDEECATLLNALFDVLEAKQLSDAAGENMAALSADPSLAYIVVKSYGNAHVRDPSDMYVSSLGALGAACGVPITDPLGAHKSKFFKKGGMPTNNDGTLHYTHADLDLDILNANHALLHAAWGALLPMESFGDIPAAVKGVTPTDKAMVEWAGYPPGIATLGLGPVPVSGLKDGKLKLGTFFGVDFTGEGPPPADGYYSRGEMKGVEGVEGLEGPPEGSVPGNYTHESFTKEFAGFHPLCKWNVSMAEVEAKAKADEEFLRTLENLWAAWLKDYDADGSKTISLEELKKFAQLPNCPSSDGYMQSLHDWASTALTDGSLETSFKEVDLDGSGELEFPEFKQMLWEDQ